MKGHLTKEKVIVLRDIVYGDSDLILHCLNECGAKVVLFARAARKSQKRFGWGTLEPMHLIEISYQKHFSESTMSGLAQLTEAILLREFSGIRRSYPCIHLGFYFLKLMGKVAQEGVVDAQSLFCLLLNSLTALEKSNDLVGLKLRFELRVLELQGVLPMSSLFFDFLNADFSPIDSTRQGDLKELKKQSQSLLAEHLGFID